MLLAEHVQRQLEGTRETLRQVPLPAPVDEVSPLVRQLITQALECPRLMQTVWSATVRLIPQHTVQDYQAEGEALLRLFDSCIATIEELARWVRQVADYHGIEFPEAARLLEAAEQVKQLRERAERDWPFFGEEQAKQAAEELKRGECGGLAELFAEVAGVGVEEWQRKVEDHRRQKSQLREGA
jgi:hypothetical protein